MVVEGAKVEEEARVGARVVGGATRGVRMGTKVTREAARPGNTTREH